MYSSITAWNADKEGWPGSIEGLHGTVKKLVRDVGFITYARSPSGESTGKAWLEIHNKLKELDALFAARLKEIEDEKAGAST